MRSYIRVGPTGGQLPSTSAGDKPDDILPTPAKVIHRSETDSSRRRYDKDKEEDIAAPRSSALAAAISRLTEYPYLEPKREARPTTRSRRWAVG